MPLPKTLIPPGKPFPKHLRILTECELVEARPARPGNLLPLELEKMKEIDKWLEPVQENVETRFNQLDKVLASMKTNKKWAIIYYLTLLLTKQRRPYLSGGNLLPDCPLYGMRFTKQEFLWRMDSPAPWTAKTKYMNFEVGGKRFTAMISPEGRRAGRYTEYTSALPHDQFHSVQCFCRWKWKPRTAGFGGTTILASRVGITTVTVQF